MIDGILSALGIKGSAATGGFIGALVSLRFVPGINIWQRATNFLGGWAGAAYSSPLAIAGLDMEENHIGGVAFMIGVLFMLIVSRITEALPKIIEDLRSWVRSGK